MQPTRIAAELKKRVAALSFAPPVTHVYNPLEYAWRSHKIYLERYATSKPRQVLLIGMNPGPFGMAQTGVPFGDVSMVRDWMGIETKVDAPAHVHPKRPITGFSCARSEVSGTRFWGWARDRFGTPENFFARFFVWNYCPLCFMEESGRNFVPEKLPAKERAPLFDACDAALGKLVDYLKPEFVIGVGKFAEARARRTLTRGTFKIGTVLHPSPASPAANKGWAKAADAALARLGVDL